MSDLPSALVYSLVTRMSAPVALVGLIGRKPTRSFGENRACFAAGFAGNTGRNAGIDAVRTIEEFLAFVPGSGVKYVLVLGGDNLTPEAQNAFLKTLEEPPRYARFCCFARDGVTFCLRLDHVW